MKTIELNRGAQEDFVLNQHQFSAYIGGVGAGKTFAGLVRGLRFAQQRPPEGSTHGAVGIVAAINYRVLEDTVITKFMEIVEGTGMLKKWLASKKRAILSVGPPGHKWEAEIRFRSLDHANWIRGAEVSWFFIDEGRHLDKGAWDILLGRLRQPGFQHAGWVCSTPNGYDWMWGLFHEESPDRTGDSQWYNAPTTENPHLDERYVASLKANYHGPFYEQEVLGHFIGVMHGQVYPHFNPKEHARVVDYRPDLPLYSCWDFGIGDLSVAIFVQVDHDAVPISQTESMFIPRLNVVDVLEGKDQSAEVWAGKFKRHLWDRFGRSTTDGDWGDPAGRQRGATGVSWIEALNAEGVPIAAAQKRAPDYGQTLLDNMAAGDRLLVDKRHAFTVARALAAHHYRTDDEGKRLSEKPVHDWTSHYSDALRYGASSLLQLFPTRTEKPPEAEPGPGTVGAWVNDILHPGFNDDWLGPQDTTDSYAQEPVSG